MTTKMAEEKVPPKEVVIPAAEAEVPADLQQKANAMADELVAMLIKQTEDYDKRLSTMEATAQPEIMDPILRGGYQYWNCLTAGPYELRRFPPRPYRAHKVIAAGEYYMFVGLIWVNPRHGPGGSLPGTIVLGGREYTARFESINLSDVTDGPDRAFTYTFASPAPVVSRIVWVTRAPDPGPAPHLYEVNLTCDLTLSGQPFAGFATWHWDPDYEPPFMMLPPVPPHLQFERPARFLIYRR